MSNVKLKNGNYIDSSGIMHNKKPLDEKLNNVIYANQTGKTASTSGATLNFSIPVTNFSKVMIITNKGTSIFDTDKMNQNLVSNGITVYFFNNGHAITYYNYTIYAVIGLG